jgi:hypothetical protein
MSKNTTIVLQHYLLQQYKRKVKLALIQTMHSVKFTVCLFYQTALNCKNIDETIYRTRECILYFEDEKYGNCAEL